MAALINNYNDSHKDWEETSGELGYAGGLDGEKLFLLDAREIEHEGYGFSHTHEGSKSQFFRQWRGVPPFPSLADDMKTGIMRANASDNLKSDGQPGMCGTMQEWFTGIQHQDWLLISIQLIRKMMSRRIRTLR